MQTVQPSLNPFALLINPADVFAAMERSGHLNGLTSRICRPLDKPLIPCTDEEAVAADAAIGQGTPAGDQR